jgi:hypothetical protein
VLNPAGSTTPDNIASLKLSDATVGYAGVATRRLHKCWEEKRNSSKFWLENNKKKRLFAISTRRQDNIKMDIRETCCEDVTCIELAQDRGHLDDEPSGLKKLNNILRVISL